MAHRTDVTQVHKNFQIRESSKMVVDPNCGRKISYKEAQSVLFREDQTLYFCSRTCREEYITQKKQLLQAA